MIYVENISALEFWLSAKRASIRLECLPRVSRLSSLPTTAHELAQTPLDILPVNRSALHLLVSDEKLRVQRRKHLYRVSTGGFVPYSFVQISEDICIASPELTLVQMSERLAPPSSPAPSMSCAERICHNVDTAEASSTRFPASRRCRGFRAARRSTRASSTHAPCSGRLPTAQKDPLRPKRRSCSFCSTCRRSAAGHKFPDSR